jgi:hypothetical protein
VIDAPTKTTAPTAPDFRIVVRRKAWDELRSMTNLKSDDALARYMHVSQSTVTRALAGTVEPSSKFIAHAMIAFGRLVPFDKLFAVKPATSTWQAAA